MGKGYPMIVKDPSDGSDIDFSAPAQIGGIVVPENLRTTSPAGNLVTSPVDVYGAPYFALGGSNGRQVLTTTATFEPATPGSGSTTLLGTQSQSVRLHRATGTHNSLRDPQASLVSRILSSAASINQRDLGAAPYKLQRFFGRSARATACFLKIYAKTAAAVGTDTPAMTIEIPASSRFDIDLGGWQSVAAGVSYAITANAADNDATGIAAGDIICANLIYG